MRRHIPRFATAMGQAALIILGAAAGTDDSLHWGARALGWLALFIGVQWSGFDDFRAGHRRGFDLGWKLRGTQSDVLGYQHFLEQAAKARAAHLAGKDDA